MFFYFNGDSNTAGTELTDPQNESLAACVAKTFGAQYLNHSFSGASCDQVISSTRAYINCCKTTNSWPDFVMIGWTDWYRQDWFHNGGTYSINSLGLNHPEKVDARRLEYFDSQIDLNVGFKASMAMYYNNIIYNLHQELTYHNVPHLFFNATESLTQYEHHSDDYRILKLDWENRYFEPYTKAMSFRKYCENKQYPHITPGFYHYQAPVHAEWAELLCSHIRLHNLV